MKKILAIGLTFLFISLVCIPANAVNIKTEKNNNNTTADDFYYFKTAEIDGTFFLAREPRLFGRFCFSVNLDMYWPDLGFFEGTITITKWDNTQQTFEFPGEYNGENIERITIFGRFAVYEEVPSLVNIERESWELHGTLYIGAITAEF